MDMSYRTFKVPKKSGGFRLVASPSAGLKLKQKKETAYLEKIFRNILWANPDIHQVPHGFMTGRGATTAARRHIGFNSTIMMDISDFFDSVHIDMLPDSVKNPIFFNQQGYCMQGFPSSPMVANIALVPVMKEIQQYLAEIEEKFAFTIYADDIAISINSENHENIKEFVKNVLEKHNFKVNLKKTRVKYAKFGYRRILGINVGDDHIRATRKTMKKIRAARYQKNGSSLGGLTTWSRCIVSKKNFY